MGFFVSRDGNYHEGDMQSGDIPCSQRPSLYATWDGIQWQPEQPATATARIDAESLADIQRDKLVRMLFEILYDHESRLRVLEVKPTITKPQYRNALLTIYKALP